VKTGQIPWLRFVGEAILIVVSILLAFGIDAWWDQRQERQEEQRLLHRLEDDFSETRELLEAAVERHRRIGEEAIRLSQVRDFETFPRSDVASWVQWSFLLYQTFHPKSGAVDALLASGQLDLISNDDLRSRLAAWPRAVREFTENEEFIVDWVRTVSASIYQAVPLGPGFSTWTGSIDEHVLTPAMLQFVTSDIGQSHAVMRGFYERYAVNDGDRLLSAVDVLLELLKSELGT